MRIQLTNQSYFAIINPINKARLNFMNNIYTVLAAIEEIALEGVLSQNEIKRLTRIKSRREKRDEQ